VHAPSAAQATLPGVQVPVGCVAGQVGHVVQVHTGVAPPPQLQMTLPNVHVPSPAVHELWLLGGVVGHVAGFPPLLLPLLLPLPPPEPLLLPLLLPLPPPEPLLLPLLLPLPPLLLPLPLDGESVLASPAPPTPAVVLPPQPGAASTMPPTATETRTRISIALMERPPQFARTRK
jgi:hypothetical protein